MSETPTVDWPALGALCDAAGKGATALRDNVEALTVDDLRRYALEQGQDPAATVAAAGLLVDLLGVLRDLAGALGRAAPRLAAALGQDPDAPVGYCPRCGGIIPLPEGGSIQCHRECGYCAHPAMDGDVCCLCGAERGTLAWAEHRGLRPGAGGRILVEKDGTGEPPASEPRIPGAMGFGHD